MPRLSMETRNVDEKVPPYDEERYLYEPGRLLPRDFVFHQASGTYNVTKSKVMKDQSEIYFADWSLSFFNLLFRGVQTKKITFCF